jgi:hypothetical protein
MGSKLMKLIRVKHMIKMETLSSAPHLEEKEEDPHRDDLTFHPETPCQEASHPRASLKKRE